MDRDWTAAVEVKEEEEDLRFSAKGTEGCISKDAKRRFRLVLTDTGCDFFFSSPYFQEDDVKISSWSASVKHVIPLRYRESHSSAVNKADKLKMPFNPQAQP